VGLLPEDSSFVAGVLFTLYARMGGVLRAEMEYCRNHLFLGDRQRRTMEEMLRVQQDSLTKYKNELDELKHAYRKENEEYPDQGSENDLFGGASAQVL
jgi:MoxR-like ATPase